MRPVCSRATSFEFAAFAGGLLGDGRAFLVSDNGVERGNEHRVLLDQVGDTLFVGFEARDGLVGEQA